jgi:hypothetical protein
MRVALDTFGPFDVISLREVVRHIDDFDEGATIYVKDVDRLQPDTPALVTSNACDPTTAERELHFRFLSEVSDAREMIETMDVKNDRDFEHLLDLIEEWGA